MAPTALIAHQNSNRWNSGQITKVM